MNVLLVAVALTSVWCTGCGKDGPNTSTVLVLTNGVMTVDTREKLEIGTDAYKQYQLEWKKVVAEGADAKLTLHVIDQNGSDVTNANVSIHFSCNNRRNEPILGRTDTNGCFVAEDRLMGEIIYSVIKEGYYRTRCSFGFMGKDTTRCIENGRWIPWNPILQVTLKEIHKPIPMIAKRLEFTLPKTAQKMGFDFLVGDWVPPHGKGKTADMVYLYEEDRIDRENYDLKLSLAFPGTDSGCYVKRKDDFSVLLSDHEARLDNYSSNIVWRIYRKDGQYVTRDKLTKSDYLVFRTRSIQDEKGNVIFAHYGKIYGPIEGPSGLDRTTHFTYYFNPTPNDRNLEYDGKNNLLKGLSSLEEVYTP